MLTSERKSFHALILVIIVVVLSISACADVGSRDVYEQTAENENDESDSSSPLITATPPNQPDLRGEEFKVLLYLSEDDKFSHLVTPIEKSLLNGIDFFNDNGGVNGAEIRLEVVRLSDKQESVSKAVLSNLKKYDPEIALFAAPMNESLYYEINQQNVPFLYFGFGKDHILEPGSKKDMVFWLVPYPEEQLVVFMELVWRNWGEVRPSGAYNELIIGYLESPGGSIHQNMEEALTALDGEGFKVRVRGRVSESPNASTSNFLLNSVNSQVTVIYSDIASVGTAVLLNDIGSLALNQAFVVGGPIWSIDSGVSEVLLADSNNEGYLLPLPVIWWTESENHAIQISNEIFDKGGNSPEDKDLAYLIGLAAADIVFEVMRRSVNRGSMDLVLDTYSNLTRLEKYSVLGGLYELDYTDGRRAPEKMYLWQYSNNEFVLIGE